MRLLQAIIESGLSAPFVHERGREREIGRDFTKLCDD